MKRTNESKPVAYSVGGILFHPSCFHEATKAVDHPYRGKAIGAIYYRIPRRGWKCRECGHGAEG